MKKSSIMLNEEGKMIPPQDYSEKDREESKQLLNIRHLQQEANGPGYRF